MSNSTNEPLAVAFQKDDVREVTRLLSEGRSVSERFHFRRTPMHLASESGATHCIRLLIERGADIDAHDEAGHTPLICALQAGHTEPATLLLAAGARLHYVFNPEDTPEIREQLRETYRRLDDESRKAHPEIYRVLNDALADTDRGAFDAEMAESLVRASVGSRDIYAVHHCCNLQTLELVAKQPGVSLKVHDGAGYLAAQNFCGRGPRRSGGLAAGAWSCAGLHLLRRHGASCIRGAKSFGVRSTAAAGGGQSQSAGRGWVRAHVERGKRRDARPFIGARS